MFGVISSIDGTQTDFISFIRIYKFCIYQGIYNYNYYSNSSQSGDVGIADKSAAFTGLEEARES